MIIIIASTITATIIRRIVITSIIIIVVVVVMYRMTVCSCGCSVNSSVELVMLLVCVMNRGRKGYYEELRDMLPKITLRPSQKKPVAFHEFALLPFLPQPLSPTQILNLVSLS